MHLAFCLFNYFPFGGLEKNFIKISRECLARGHSLDIFTMSWDGEKPHGAHVTLVPASGLSNHRQAASYVDNLSSCIDRSVYDLIIGFNKMPGLDLYYAADVCYKARIQKQRSFLSRLTPRYRLLSRFECAVFSQASSTEIIILSENEKNRYQDIYGTQEHRFHSVPPGVNKKQIRYCLGEKNRNKIRKKLKLTESDNLLLMIGSHFHTKGVDRALLALASLPLALQKSTYLFIIGKGDEKKYLQQAKKLGIVNNVQFLGTRNDVPQFLAGADIVLQPSRTENTGNAIVEAIVAGIPVLATELCGYAFHIAQAQAGKIIPCTPFNQGTMNTMLQEMLTSQERELWGKQAILYSDKTDLYNRFQVIADLIEHVGKKHIVRMQDS